MHTLLISWNCIGWQSLVLLGVSFVSGLRGRHPLEARVQVVVIGVAGTMLLNLLRVAAVAAHRRPRRGQTPAVLFHDYGGTLLVIGWLFAFWMFVQRWILPADRVGRPELVTRELSSPNLSASSRNRWIRLALQTAFGLLLLWLWLRTVSLPEVAAHMRVQRWWPLPLMIVLFLRDERHPRPPLAAAAAPARAGRDGAGVRHERGRRPAQLRAADPLRRRRARVVAVAPAPRAGGLSPRDDRHRQGVRPGRRGAGAGGPRGGRARPARSPRRAACSARPRSRSRCWRRCSAPRCSVRASRVRALARRVAAGALRRRRSPARRSPSAPARAACGRRRSPARLAGLTALALVIDAFNFTLLFVAVGISVPTLKAMAAYPALLLSFAVPAGPGYLGNLEVAGSLVLGGGLGLAPAVAAGRDRPVPRDHGGHTRWCSAC